MPQAVEGPYHWRGLSCQGNCTVVMAPLLVATSISKHRHQVSTVPSLCTWCVPLGPTVRLIPLGFNIPEANQRSFQALRPFGLFRECNRLSHWKKQRLLSFHRAGGLSKHAKAKQPIEIISIYFNRLENMLKPFAASISQGPAQSFQRLSPLRGR